MACPLLDYFHCRKEACEVVASEVMETADESELYSLRMVRFLATLLLLVVVFVGCGIPVSRTMIIPKDVAHTPEHLIAKLDLLKTGMEVREVFELLDIKRTTSGVREIVNAEEKQRTLYGATQLIGTPQELEQFRSYLGKHRIFEIRFRDIKSGLIFDSPVSVVSTKVGPDFCSYIVFYESKLINPPSKPDNFYQDESTRTYISDLFGTMFRSGLSRIGN